MEKVYSVGRGRIIEYEIIKETNCFYNIILKNYNNRISKDGQSLQACNGGRTVVTKNILKAVTVAQDQINRIQFYLDEYIKRNCESEKLLKEFSDLNTV